MVLTVRRLKMEAWQFYTNTNKIKLMPGPQSQYQQQQQQRRTVKQRQHYTHHHHHQQQQQQQKRQHHHSIHQQEQHQHHAGQQEQEENQQQIRQQCHWQRHHQHQHRYQNQPQQQQQTPHHLQKENISEQQQHSPLQHQHQQRPHAENHIFITNVNQNCYTASRFVNKQTQKTITATASEEDCCPKAAHIPTPAPDSCISHTTIATTQCQPNCKQTALVDICPHLLPAHGQTSTIQSYKENLYSNLYQHQQQQEYAQCQQQLQQAQFQPLHQPNYLPTLHTNNTNENHNQNTNKSLALRKRLLSCSAVMEHLLLIASVLIALSGLVVGDPESQDFQKNSKYR
uniref:Uncharacterized protein n=1 Tax=Stomoxys calcitrans TaxID=35570 RepID=A0A1I8P7N0_STOCA